MKLTPKRSSAGTISAGAVLLLGATVALAATPKPGSYSGSTAQSLPLVFGVASGGKLITNFQPTFVGKCTKKGAATIKTPQITTDAGRNITIKKDAFKTRGKNGEIHTGKGASNKVIGTGTDVVSGKFTSSRAAKGTYSVQITFNKSAPTPYPGYHCKTGTLKWTAKRT